MNPRLEIHRPPITPLKLLDQSIEEVGRSLCILQPNLDKYDRILQSFENREYPAWLAEKLGVPEESIVRGMANADGAYKIPTKDGGAIFDCGNLIRFKSSSNDEIAMAVTLAQAKGWSTINLAGSESYRRDAWITATRMGYTSENIKGYVPTADDVEIAHYIKSNLTIAPTLSLAPTAERDDKRGEGTDTEAKPVMTPRMKMGGRYGK